VGGTPVKADTCYEICGDGLDFGHYPCDDGNRANYDGCNNKCQIDDGWYCYGGSPTHASICDEICGDTWFYHYEQAYMECDDGNTVSGDGCSSICMVESGYDCTGPSASYDVDSTCKDICGDGLRMEAPSVTTYCDVGQHGANVNGCFANCTVEDGWYCYGGDKTHSDSCFEKCGDGMFFDQSYIQCDDGNLNNYDGCTPTCSVEEGFYCWETTAASVVSGQNINQGTSICKEICGNPYGDFGTFPCNDGNLVNYDGCSKSCQVEEGFYCYQKSAYDLSTCVEYCGDKYDFETYPCEDGNLIKYDGCTHCHIDDGYYCVESTKTYSVDNHTVSGPDHCYDICGDGLLMDRALYTCDDGNTISGDGCSSKCQIERGWQCSGGNHHHKDTCKEICGDGLDMHSYAYDCDDGNIISGDGCSSTCHIEEGWYCYGGSPVTRDYCYEICGDTHNFGHIPCEDGNTRSGDGCSSTCQIEEGWYCYGGSATSIDTCYDICGDGKLEPDHRSTCDIGPDPRGIYQGCYGCKIVDGWYCYGGSPTSTSTCKELVGDGRDFNTF